MIITIMNNKGGVAKTTTTQALGLALQKMGYKVLLVDLDGQASLSKICNYDEDKDTITDVLTSNIHINDVIQKTFINIVPADEGLFSLYNDSNKIGIMSKVIKPLNNDYDYIIIDTAPSSSFLNTGALLASDKVIVPVEPDIMGIEGIYILSEAYKSAKYVNENLELLGILVTQYNQRQNLDSQAIKILDELSEVLNTKLFNTKIRRSVVVREAQGQRLNMFDYDPNNNAVKDYMNFAKEVVAILND